MIIGKSTREIEKMRRAGELVSRIHEAVCRYIQPGVTTVILDNIIEGQIRSAGALPTLKGYNGYPHSTYFSPNEFVTNSPPTRVPLRQGDIVTLEFGVTLEGFCGWQAITYPVGQVDARDVGLLTVTHQALENAVSAARIGNKLGDISFAIQSTVEKAGFSVCKEWGGCGVGRRMHEDPFISNLGRPGTGPGLRSGYLFSIVPIVCAGRPDIESLPNGLSTVTADGKRVACYSHIVSISEQGGEILTPYKFDWIGKWSANDSILIINWSGTIRVLPVKSLDEIHCLTLERGERLIVSSAQALCEKTHIVLSSEIDELEWLLNKSDLREEELHKFFEHHPHFLLGSDYKSLRSKVILERDTGNSLIPDFFLEPIMGEYWDLLDLKLPNKPLTVGPQDRRRFSHHIYEAQAQLREYAVYFEDPRHRSGVFTQHGIKAYRPRMGVVIGRSFIDEEPIRRQIEDDIPSLRIITYDELLAKAKQRTLLL